MDRASGVCAKCNKRSVDSISYLSKGTGLCYPCALRNLRTDAIRKAEYMADWASRLKHAEDAADDRWARLAEQADMAEDLGSEDEEIGYLRTETIK